MTKAKDRTSRMAVGLVKSAAEKETTTSFLWTSAQAELLSRPNCCDPVAEEMLAISAYRRQRAKRGASARNPVLVEGENQITPSSVCNVFAQSLRDAGSTPARSTTFREQHKRPADGSVMVNGCHAPLAKGKGPTQGAN